MGGNLHTALGQTRLRSIKVAAMLIKTLQPRFKAVGALRRHHRPRNRRKPGLVLQNHTGGARCQYQGRLGGCDKDDRETHVLNLIVRWTRTGIRVEADPRHTEVVLSQMGLGGANKACSPGV